MFAVCADVVDLVAPEQITIQRRESGTGAVVPVEEKKVVKNIGDWPQNVQRIFRTRLDLVQLYPETYTITENLGTGAFGNVFAAHCSDPTLPAIVVKFVNEDPEERPRTPKLRGETYTLRSLDLCGDSVKFKQWQEQNPGIFIQYMRSDSISDYSAEYTGTFQDGWCLLHRYGPSLNLLSPDELGRVDLAILACQMTDALHYLHQRRVTHGDIKAGNICLTRDRTSFVLIDLGEVRSYFSDQETVDDMASMYRTKNYDSLLEDKKAYGTLSLCPVDQMFGSASVLGDFESLGYVLLYTRNMREGLPWLSWAGNAYRADGVDYDKDRAFLAMVPYKLDAVFGAGVDGLVRDNDPFQQALKTFMRIALRRDRVNYGNTVEGCAKCERDYQMLRNALVAGFESLQPHERNPLFAKAKDQLVSTTSVPHTTPLPMPSWRPAPAWPISTGAPPPPKQAHCDPIIYYTVASSGKDDVCQKIDDWMTKSAGCAVSNRLHDAPKNSFIVLFFDGTCGGGEDAVTQLYDYVTKTRAPHTLFSVGIASKFADQAWHQAGIHDTDFQIGPDLEEMQEVFIDAKFGIISYFFKEACKSV